MKRYYCRPAIARKFTWRAKIRTLCNSGSVDSPVRQILTRWGSERSPLHSSNRSADAQDINRKVAVPAGMAIDFHCYLHQDDAVVRHLLRVSSGLDSMVPGEPQIFGQVKQAYRLACEAGSAGQALQHLFPAAFAPVKVFVRKPKLAPIRSPSLMPR